MKALILLPLLVWLTAASAVAGQGSGLEQYRWKSRLLLVFAPSETDSSYQDLQCRIHTRGEELAERDLVVFRLFEDGSGSVDGKPVAKDRVRSLRSRFAPRPGALTLVLVGKDGGEKLRQVDGFELQEVLDRIDAMPMRQREMRERGKE
jgi:hypothetical protein